MNGASHDKAQAIWADTYRLGNAAVRHGGVRRTDVAFLIWLSTQSAKPRLATRGANAVI
jgi:hypothetical protein